jgi:predicted alpha/beta-fold hydrolase
MKESSTNAVEMIASFRPRRFLRNGHLQTIIGNYLRRVDALPAAVPYVVEVAPGTSSLPPSQVLCHCHFQPAEVRANRPTAVIVHGLEGSSKSQYVVGNANKLWAAGCNVIRMNMRNCGGTERLSPTLYHSGLSGDVEAVMRFFIAQQGFKSIALIGYSMGGNLVLKLAGDLGEAAPLQLKSVIGVSPAIDLGASADALHEPLNRIYEMKFLRSLVARYRRKAELLPKIYDPRRAKGLRSLRDFDERVTAFYAGFEGADDYYNRAAAARVIRCIRVPTLVLHSLDDPFVRLTEESRATLVANSCVTLLETVHGGHCAFLADAHTDLEDDGYWAESMLLRFMLSNSGQTR